MSVVSKNKVIVQGDIDTASPTLRITNLENNEYKITYYEIVSGASGSLTVPSQATINADEFGLSGNSILSKIDGFGKPTYESPVTSGGVAVTANLNTTTGAWVTSGTYTDTSVALIYSIRIKAVYMSNLTYNNIIGDIQVNTPTLQQVTTAGNTSTNGVVFNGATDALNKVTITPADGGPGIVTVFNSVGGVSTIINGLTGVTSTTFIKSGGTASQFLKANGSVDSTVYAPTTYVDAQDAITLASANNYTDNLATGLSWKKSVLYSTTTGENLTLTGLSATVDGTLRTLLATDRILVKNQTNQTQNGLYNPTAGAWNRVVDANTNTSILSATVYVRDGNLEKNRVYAVNVTPVTLGTTNITFALISGAGAYTYGAYLKLTGNVFDIDFTTFTTAQITDSTNKRYQTDSQQTFNDATSSIQTQINGKEVTSNKDATGGYVGLTLFKINFKNALNTITSFFTNANTASRTYTFPDKDITVAGLVDITGTNSGTNTGDNAVNSNYANDYRLANFVAGTNYLAPNGSASALTGFPTLNQNTTGNASTATNLTGLTTTIATLNNVSGVNSGNETATSIATINHSATVKSVLLDADELTGQDSASTFSLFRSTLLNVWTYVSKKFETKTNGGDAAYSILANDNVIVTGTALTLPRIWTLPSAASVNAGNEKVISDSTSTITATNTITIAVQTGQYLNGVLNGTELMMSAGAHRRLFSDGVNNWFFDAGVVRLGATQTLTNKTLVTPIIGSITGVAGVNGLTIITNNTASVAIARGLNLTPTLIAAANSDVLVGLDINPTFTNGAFTGVTNLALRVKGSISAMTASVTETTVLQVGNAGGNVIIGNFNTGASNYPCMWIGLTPTTISSTNYIFQGDGATRMFFNSPGYLAFRSSNVDMLRIFTTGNLTIQNGGTFTDAGYRLDVQGTIRTSDQLNITTVGKGISIKEGTNAKMGLATMVAGTVTVANTSVTANSRIFLTIQSLGTVTVPMAIGVTAKTAGTSFVITSANVTDSSIIAWEIKEAL